MPRAAAAAGSGSARARRRRILQRIVLAERLEPPVRGARRCSVAKPVATTHLFRQEGARDAVHGRLLRLLETRPFACCSSLAGTTLATSSGAAGRARVAGALHAVMTSSLVCVDRGQLGEGERLRFERGLARGTNDEMGMGCARGRVVFVRCVSKYTFAKEGEEAI